MSILHNGNKYFFINNNLMWVHIFRSHWSFLEQLVYGVEIQELPMIFSWTVGVWSWNTGTAKVVSWCVYNMKKISMRPMNSNIRLLFDYWTIMVVHLLLLNSLIKTMSDFVAKLVLSFLCVVMLTAIATWINSCLLSEMAEYLK